MGFAGRVVVVSGGATGMGRATVDLLLERGARVALIDWNRKEAEAIPHTDAFRAYVADVSDEGQVQQAFADIDRDFGPIHGLFSNAGVARTEALIHEESAQRWDEVIGINLRGTFLVVREAMRRFVAQNAPAAIVCTSSAMAKLAIPGGTNAYTASKGAIEALVRQVAVDYAPRRIRINAVAPGAIDTPLMWATTPADQQAEMRKTIDTEVPLGKIGQPIDIAHCVAYLLSDESAYVTGATFLIDGGVGAKMVLSV
ncbi:MAG TPA: SDR family NAD(P)-dependent oxidoreductase [Candidatus Dormibacteraeota bacterium]|nr:SDR family NAD(P)-dependent oxidoreductase [Candidatus Dormibacteraeota bacterium]